MLPDAALSLVREVSEAQGGCLLVDGRRGRALLSDPGRLLDVCKGLRRGGFTRAIDFTAMDLAPVRAEHSLGPEEMGGGYARPLQEKAGQDPPLQNHFAFYLQLRAPQFGHCGLLLKWKWTLASEPHPSLSVVWPSCGLAERELLEMLGIPFAGNSDLRPLLLDMRFQGHPLRSDFRPPPPHAYAAQLLADRHEAGLIFGLRQAADNAAGASLDSPNSALKEGGSRPATTTEPAKARVEHAPPPQDEEGQP